jgi:mxaJ protein
MKHLRIALVAIAVTAVGLAAATPAQAQPSSPLRVCADPNYIPYSNRDGAGFENKIASVVAKALDRPLQYVWVSIRGDAGFAQMVHEDLDAGKCDVIVDLPYAETDVKTTNPYYVSSYVFIYKRSLRNITSLDSPALRHLKIGYEADTPVEVGLKLRALTIGAKPFLTADEEDASPDSIVNAVAAGTINVGLSWAPAVGYFVGQHPDLTEHVIPNSRSQGSPEQYTFPMAMGTRLNNDTLASQLNRALTQSRPQIYDILDQFHITYLKPNGNG